MFISLTNVLVAQKLTLQAGKTQVGVGEAFQISVSLNTIGNGLKIANLNDFEIYQGPYNSSSTSIMNGTVTQSNTLTYVIGAKKEGKFTLGPASVIINGSTFKSNSLTIEVVKGVGNANSQANANQQSQSSSGGTSEDGGNNLFVKTIVSKTKAYQGEQIAVTQKVYTRYHLKDFRDIKFPEYTGFWAQDVPINQQIQVQNENIDGVNYQVAELRRTFIFAQRSGKLEIEPIKIDCAVRKKSTKNPRDIFEQFFGGGFEDVVYSVKSKPVTIDIVPLPETNKPENFSGAVGEYSFKAQLNKDKVKADDGVNLIISLTGKGNIKLVDPLKIGFPEDFETFDPKITENISVGANGVSGTKTFDYLFIPRHEGDYKIDQISFTYFDPVKKNYITIPSPDFNLHVAKGSGVSATVIGNSSRQNDLKILGNDIRYIKTNPINLTTKDDYFFGSFPFYVGLICPFLIFSSFIFLRRKNIELNKDVIAVKSRKATKMARKRLSLAEQHLKSNNKELFYIEISRALFGYVSDKLNIPVADLNKEHISNTLKIKNVGESTIQQLIKTIDNCEYARYAPSAVSDDLKNIFSTTVELIAKIEDETK